MNSAQEPSHLPGADDDPPQPPVDLDQWSLPLVTLPPITLYRGHATRRDPLHFNTRAGRWTSPDGTFGTLYVAEQEACAFLEVFGQQLLVNAGGPWITARSLQQYCLCQVTTTQHLRVVDLTHGAALTALAADARVTNGAHALSRQWARALYTHPSAPHGIRYRSRRAPEYACLALFDRAAPAMQTDCSTNLLQDTVRLGALLDALDVMLVP